MSTPQPDPSPPSGPRLVLGPVQLSGSLALVVALAMLVGFIGLVVWSRPSPFMLVAGAMWIGFLVYWSAAAGRRVEKRSEEPAASRALHRNLLNLGLVLLFVSIPGLRWRFLPQAAWTAPVGLAIMAAATLLHVWARVHLGRNWTSEVAIQQGHQLVTSGPYRLVRHPVYTALIALALGTAIVSGRILSLVGAITFAVAYVRKLRLEEQGLSATFGAQWDEYRRRSWALVPLIF
jgi:protein-S-isoprenylcysteine O-methyltransferase Ste14